MPVCSFADGNTHTLSVSSHEGTSPFLSGFVVDDLCLTTGEALCYLGDTTEGPAQMSVAPPLMDFAYVAVDGTRDLTLYINNTGSEALSGDISLPAGTPFSLVVSAHADLFIPGGKGVAVPVRFHPTSAGAYSAGITLTGGGGATVQAIGHTATPNTTTLPGVIRINEIVSNNVSGLVDEDGSHENWIEIYNGTSNDIGLNGWSLEDDSSNAWTFPGVTLPTGEAMIVFFSGPGNARPPLPGKYLHAGIDLNAGGGHLKLLDDSDVLKDEVMYPDLPSNFSYAYFDNVSGYAVVASQTPCELANGD